MSVAKSGPKAGSRLAPEARTAELMRVARELLREVGYEKFLPAEVARRAGVSEALVYRYFPTKRDLLARVTNEWFGEILDVQTALEGVTGTYERLKIVVGYGLEVVHSEPELTRYLFSELRSAPDYRHSAAYELNLRYTGIVEQVVREAIAAGEFLDDVDVHTVRDMIFGAIEHRTWAYLRGRGPFPFAGTAEEITKVIYRGMSVTAPPI